MTEARWHKFPQELPEKGSFCYVACAAKGTALVINMPVQWDGERFNLYVAVHGLWIAAWYPIDPPPEYIEE